MMLVHNKRLTSIAGVWVIVCYTTSIRNPGLSELTSQGGWETRGGGRGVRVWSVTINTASELYTAERGR